MKEVYARATRNNCHIEIAHGFNVLGVGYFRPGSYVSAIQKRKSNALVTLVPALKKKRGFGKPTTITVPWDVVSKYV